MNLDEKQNYLTAVNNLLIQDMQDPNSAKQVKAEKNKLATAVAIRQEREAYGWTQQELANGADLP